MNRMKTPFLVSCVIGAVAAVAAVAVVAAAPQDASTPAPAAFEVATVKPNKSGDGRQFIQRQPGGRVTVTNMPLRQLITFAYQLAPFQLVGGPSWIASRSLRHGREARRQSGIPGRQARGPDPIQLAMRTLMADRFKLKTHRETREMDIYALTLVKPGVPGPALKPADDRLRGADESRTARRRPAAGPPRFRRAASCRAASWAAPA